MTYHLAASPPLLIAIPDVWQSFIVQTITQNGYPIITAASYQETLDYVRLRTLRGLIMTNEWALQRYDENHTLFEHVRGRIPTLTLIKHGGNPIIIQVFDPPKHQYLTVPVAADEVIGLMRRAGMIEESSL
jgi:hypothetical protein